MGARVKLPPAVSEPYTVYVNGVPAREGTDYVVRGRVLEFSQPLQKEGRLSLWRWFLGAWGIGTYGRNDQVDLTWEQDGRPRIAHALDIEPGDEPAR